MGRHVWDNAQHADALGRRLPELRAHAQESEPAGEGFVAFMDALESAETPELTVERLVGVYRVLKPHLLAAYERDLASANAVYEPPTRRILARCAEDERRHIAAGERVLAHLATTPARRERAAAWAERLGGLLAAAGGVTGEGLPAPVPAPVSPEGMTEAEEFIRLETRPARWPVPDDLRAAAAALGDALVARDAAAVRRWLAGDAVWSEAEDSMLAAARFTAPRDRGRHAHRPAAAPEAPPGRSRGIGDAGRPLGGRAGGLARTGPRRGPRSGRPLRLTARALERPRRQSRGDRPPGHPRLPGPGGAGGRGLLRGRRRLASRPGRRPGGVDRSGARPGQLSERRPHPRRRARDGRAGRPSRVWIPLGELALRQGLRGGRARLHRAAVARHPADGRQGRGAPPDAGGGRAGGARQRGRA